jgi:hypothetical protein
MDHRFTQEQIHLILKESKAGEDTYELCLKHGISETTLYEWLAQYGYADDSKQKGFSYKRLLGNFLNGGLVTRRELLAGSASGAAGFAAGHFFAFGMKNKAESSQERMIEVVNAGQFKQSTEKFGRYIYLTPQKLGGGTHAVDLQTGKTLAWISYWNYGDSCPISHHLAAYPSPDPYKGFEFVNSTQGGDNVMIYGLPTPIKQRGLLDKWGQGNHIYRVQYDGQQMNLIEDVAETTGMGLGVHITIYPDANGFAAADGQKDIGCFFNRAGLDEKTKALAAFRADWIGKESGGNLEENWSKGGTLRIVRIDPAKETGKFDLEGSKGNKITWEMVPMAENLVYTGQLPGDSPRTLSGLDAVVHHPGNRYSALIIRMLSCAVIIDRQTWEPVACLNSPEGSADNLKVTKLHTNPDTWEIQFDDVKCVGHEAGFSPNGKFFTMMNNIKQNNMAVYDTSDPDPRKWNKITFVKDPSWKGDYPSPFHLCFSVDGSKMFVSVLYPKPALSGCCVVDTKTWKIIKKFKDIGPDCQTMSVSYDGKYVFQIFSGFQRLSTGAFIFTQDTLEPLGYLPNFGGHHDCVVVPTKVEQLRNSRCTTL